MSDFRNPNSEIQALKNDASLNARKVMLEYKGTHILVTGIVLGALIFLGIWTVYYVISILK